MSYKGWIIAIIVLILVMYGVIFFVRSTIERVPQDDTICYNIDDEGIPKFIDTDFIELNKIEYITRFRSGEGTVVPDNDEKCRLLYHGYIPFYKNMNEYGVKIFSPIDGKITDFINMWVSGDISYKEVRDDSYVWLIIQSSEYPAIDVHVFGVDIRNMNLKYGMNVSKGQHIGYMTNKYAFNLLYVPMVNILVKINKCPGESEIVSYFDVMTDDLFQHYNDRGATSRDQFIVTKEERDAAPLKCVFSSYVNSYHASENWIIPNMVYLGDSPSDFEIITRENPDISSME